MGKLDGVEGAKAPGGFCDGEGKCPFEASWNASLRAGIPSNRLLPG